MLDQLQKGADILLIDVPFAMKMKRTMIIYCFNARRLETYGLFCLHFLEYHGICLALLESF